MCSMCVATGAPLRPLVGGDVTVGNVQAVTSAGGSPAGNRPTPGPRRSPTPGLPFAIVAAAERRGLRHGDPCAGTRLPDRCSPDDTDDARCRVPHRDAGRPISPWWLRRLEPAPRDSNRGVRCPPGERRARRARRSGFLPIRISLRCVRPPPWVSARRSGDWREEVGAPRRGVQVGR
jgi:hypothetical protein